MYEQEDPAYGVIVKAENGSVVKTRVFASRTEALAEAEFVNLIRCGVFAEAVDEFLCRMEPCEEEKSEICERLRHRIYALAGGIA